jgi:putative inorganic carbon (HCO3(-)) transporter
MIRTLVVLAVVGCGVAAALVSRFAALCTYVWFALFRPQEWVWVDITALRLSLVLGLVLLVPSLLTGVLPNLTHPLSLGTMAFLATGALAQFTAVNPVQGWNALDAHIRLTVVALLAVTILDARRRILLFVAVVAGSFGFHTAKAGLAYILGGGTFYADGLAGAFVDNNGYATGAAMTLPLLAVMFQNRDRQSTLGRVVGWAFLLAAPLTTLLVVGTRSRGGFLAVCAAVLCLAMLQRRRGAAFAAIAVIVVGLALVTPISDSYLDRLQTIQTYQEVGDRSALGRLHFWAVARQMAAANVFGVGLRNYDSAYDAYDFSDGAFGPARSVHSSHFQVLAEQGYPGLLVWLCMFAYAFFAALRVRRFGLAEGRLDAEESLFYTTLPSALVASMAAFLVGGAFIAASLNDLTWYTFAVVAAVDRLALRHRADLDRPSTPATAGDVMPQWRATA